MSGKVREFDNDWRVATLKIGTSLLLPCLTFRMVLGFLRLLIFEFGARMGQTGRQTDGQDLYCGLLGRLQNEWRTVRIISVDITEL